MNANAILNLKCPVCVNGIVSLSSATARCAICGNTYKVQNGVPILVSSEKATVHAIGANDGIIHSLKIFFKKFPKIFTILYYAFGALPVGRGPLTILPVKEENKIILNLGSGIKRIREDVINMDVHPFSNVDVVGDIYALPFKTNSADVVIAECLLEHLTNPLKAVQEMQRVLKPDGKCYITVPFMEPYHSSPGDYYRWSSEGIKEIMDQNGFMEIKSGIMFGPSSAFMAVFVEWLATLLSFGSHTLHQIFAIIFTIVATPLKLFDYLIVHYPSAKNSAFGFYYIGTKSK